MADQAGIDVAEHTADHRALDEELDRWELRGVDMTLPEDAEELWARLRSRHPQLLAAVLRVEGRERDILIMRADIQSGDLLAWLREIRERLEGHRPVNWIAGGDLLPNAWYVFAAGD